MALTNLSNIFAGNPLDRADHRRADAAWIADRWADGSSLVALIRAGAPLVEPSASGDLRLAYLPAGSPTSSDCPADRRLFLGLWKDVAVFAVDLVGPLDEADIALLPDAAFEELRPIGLRLPAGDAGIIATAKAVFEWSRRHGYCGACGGATAVHHAGWRRVCTACGTEHFPRTDPVTIMLPTFGDRCLMGRQAAWPEGMFSALAGFVEPGESLEEACARELAEEAQLEAVSVTYHSCQPWPYPCNLMIGLFAEVAHDRAVADGVEIEQVRWFTRDEARALIRGEVEGAWAPSKLAIAGILLRAWAGVD